MVKNVKYESPEDMPIISGGGYGTCATCGCTGFTESGTICDRCGHNYSEHW